jgi:16S rRNA processing protein RimM
MDATRRVVLGRIGGAHGVRGWMRVRSFTDPPEALLGYPGWQLRREDGQQQDCEVRDAEWHGAVLRVALVGVEDRDAAELLRGAAITVERAALRRLARREYYQDDLLGFEVRNEQGALLGTLSHFIDAPAAPVMVVTGAREYWIPAAPPHLRRVELAARMVRVDWPEDF